MSANPIETVQQWALRDRLLDLTLIFTQFVGLILMCLVIAFFGPEEAKSWMFTTASGCFLVCCAIAWKMRRVWRRIQALEEFVP